MQGKKIITVKFLTKQCARRFDTTIKEMIDYRQKTIFSQEEFSAVASNGKTLQFPVAPNHNEFKKSIGFSLSHYVQLKVDLKSDQKKYSETKGKKNPKFF